MKRIKICQFGNTAALAIIFRAVFSHLQDKIFFFGAQVITYPEIYFFMLLSEERLTDQDRSFPFK